MKAVFWLGIMFLMQISRLRFKQSRIYMFISRPTFAELILAFLDPNLSSASVSRGLGITDFTNLIG